MNTTLVTEVVHALMADLRAFAAISEEILRLSTREHQALSGQADHQLAEFYEKRKTLLPDIESLLRKFRNHRMTWQQIPQAQREHFKELKTLFQSIQGLLTRVMVLDRENQQAMLKRGLVPVKHLPGMAVQQPHYVADLYRRNSGC
jgi:hypothetical protein